MVNIMEIMGDKAFSIKPRIILFVWLSLLFSGDLLAEIRVEPDIAASISYTDNVALSEDVSAVSAGIMQFTPGLSLYANGRSVDAAIRYELQNLYFTDDASTGLDKYQYYHKLNGTVKAEIQENLLYFDGGLSTYQLSPTTNGLETLDNFSLSANRQTVKRVSLSPYLSTRLGEYANTEVRYRYTNLMGDSRVVNDSHINEVSFSLDSGEMFNRIIWSLDGISRDVVYEAQDDTSFESIAIGMDYELSDKINVLLKAGYENNEYQTFAVNSIDDNYWSVGVRFQPGDRTDILLESGHRYFGDTGLVDINHRARNTNWKVSYLEDITTRSLLDIESQVVLVANDSEQAIGDSQIFGLLSLPSLTTEAILRKRTTAGVELNYNKLMGRINLSQTKYDYQLSGDSERINAADLGLIWSYTSKTDISVTKYYQHRDFQTSGTRERLQQWILAMNQLISRRTSINLEYRNTSLESDTGSDEYTQNVYSLGIKTKF